MEDLLIAGDQVLDLKYGRASGGDATKTAVCGSVSCDGLKALVGYSDGSAALFAFGECIPLLTVNRFSPDELHDDRDKWPL